jgi:hypothetical protein
MEGMEQPTVAFAVIADFFARKVLQKKINH